MLFTMEPHKLWLPSYTYTSTGQWIFALVFLLEELEDSTALVYIV